MQTPCSDEKAVCLSVCLSFKRVNFDKTEEKSVQIFIPYQRLFSLVFWQEEQLVGSNTIYLKFWVNSPYFACFLLQNSIALQANYEGRPINKLKNGIILLIFKI